MLAVFIYKPADRWHIFIRVKRWKNLQIEIKLLYIMASSNLLLLPLLAASLPQGIGDAGHYIILQKIQQILVTVQMEALKLGGSSRSIQC
nr:hypothetical protein Iba_chr13cCG6120 [Ipomoea batatas]GMD82910.1 hypothetical protein Iba_scaffold52585CG0010 [Ipomoea batatas]